MSSSESNSETDLVPKDEAEIEIRTVDERVARNRERRLDRSRNPVLDEIDRAIIRLLQKDGRASNTEIGRELNLTETTIRKRVARLITDDLISVVAVPTPEAVGLTTSAIIGISVQLQRLHAVSAELVALPEVRYVGMSTGRYELIIEAFFVDHEHLLEFVSQGLGEMEGVTAIETSLILKVAKFSYEWEIT
jgi:Lrp/AsnC family transcriptional regulator, regulator for asnA, asnC and gidA